MRHLKRTAKLGRTGSHRNAMLANLVCSLIQHKRVTTTLAKAKAARSVAEKMVTLGKSGTIHDRRLATAHLKYNPRHTQKSKEAAKKARKNDIIRILFDEIAPSFKDRRGGYTRIVKLNQRQGDAADLAILEWVDFSVGATAPVSGESKAAGQSNPPAEESKPSSEQK
ncbi:MAG: 50S ribosomal protein L17 [Verrucomicrobiota bacterium]